ncbi:TPA: hypothetical protein N0F65_009779 [Lagenidium giganteum]|uniref:PiggyBac transposable element-derived protein domain-containing protein n=1 Tax=Lagenidium giganteum TaxID=4803 RepID=A0AAV2YUY7_9STRA|nr:TPA: hypothetical protein N0F65_009779 [Lagenidium giganteum]
MTPKIIFFDSDCDMVLYEDNPGAPSCDDEDSASSDKDDDHDHHEDAAIDALDAYDDQEGDEEEDDEEEKRWDSYQPFAAWHRLEDHRDQATAFVNAQPWARKTTKYFCDACSEEDKRIYLCNVLRHPQFGDNATCFQIWHKMWPCGTELPFVNKKIQMRGPGKKRSHRQVFGDDGVDD